VLAAALAAPWPVAAAETVSVEAARAFVADFGDRTLGAIKVPSRSVDERTVELGRVLIDGVDFETLARFVLGRRGRRAKGAQFREFTQLFAAHIIDLAIERFAEMEVQGYEITKVREMPDGDVLVTTEITHGSGEPFKAGWRVRLRDGRYRVNDLLVEGYSIGIHFRNQFERSVHAGLPGLIQKLRQLTRGSPAVAVAKQQAAVQ
jgi:phospholipid transport system substrate-binding protein